MDLSGSVSYMRRDIVNLGLDHGVMQFYVAAATKSKLQWTEETASKVLLVAAAT